MMTASNLAKLRSVGAGFRRAHASTQTDQWWVAQMLKEQRPENPIGAQLALRLVEAARESGLAPSAFVADFYRKVDSYTGRRNG